MSEKAGIVGVDEGNGVGVVVVSVVGWRRARVAAVK